VRAYKELDNPNVEYKPKLLIGSRLVLMTARRTFWSIPRDRAAYGRLCQLLTRGKRGRRYREGRMSPRGSMTSWNSPKGSFSC